MAVAYDKIRVAELGKRNVQKSYRQVKAVIVDIAILTRDSLRQSNVREPSNLALIDGRIVGMTCCARYSTVRV